MPMLQWRGYPVHRCLPALLLVELLNVMAGSAVKQESHPSQSQGVASLLLAGKEKCNDHKVVKCVWQTCSWSNIALYSNNTCISTSSIARKMYILLATLALLIEICFQSCHIAFNSREGH